MSKCCKLDVHEKSETLATGTLSHRPRNRRQRFHRLVSSSLQPEAFAHRVPELHSELPERPGGAVHQLSGLR